MSSVYQLEPPTSGKVLLKTTLGDVDIELWSREAPLACENFIRHAASGYYDGALFHRVIRNTLAQTGDPTGEGRGGQSAFTGGAAFKDEFHQRLKFNHRGLVGMANENKPHTNKSQFFITLGKCEWLTGKHTIFGKVTGDTIFNALKLNEVDTDSATDRPLEPVAITGAEILSCPFPELADELEQNAIQARARAESARAETAASKKRARPVKKKLSLISFGDEFEDEENNAAMSGACAIGMQSIYDTFQSKSKSKHEVKPKSKPTVETKKRKEPSDGGSELKAMTKMPKKKKKRRRRERSEVAQKR